jgi:hypothetical protein
MNEKCKVSSVKFINLEEAANPYVLVYCKSQVTADSVEIRLDC